MGRCSERKIIMAQDYKNYWFTLALLVFLLGSLWAMSMIKSGQRWSNHNDVKYSRLRSIGENWRMLTNGPIGFRFPGGIWFSNKIRILLTGAVEAKATVRLSSQSFSANGLRPVLHFKVELEGPPKHNLFRLIWNFDDRLLWQPLKLWSH